MIFCRLYNIQLAKKDASGNVITDTEGKEVIETLELDDSIDWLSTDWQISDTLSFSNIIAESMEDKVNKRAIVFNIETVPGKKYYARARIETSNGWSKFTNLVVFTAKTLSDVDDITELPSLLSSTDVYTDSDINNHVPVGFNIKTRAFSAVGNAAHFATSYWIEDEIGNVIWSSILDEINKSSILVSDVILNENTIYRIKAVFHSTSNDTSTISTKYICTGKNEPDANTGRLGTAIKEANFETNEDIIVSLSKPVETNEEVKIDIVIKEFGYGVTKDAFSKIDTFTSNVLLVNIPINLISKDKTYLVLITYNNDQTSYTIVNTFE